MIPTFIPPIHRTNPNPGSDAGSSRFAHTSSTFEIEAPKTKGKLWYHWFNIRIRQYMILEIFFFACLFMIFYKLQTISNQNNWVLEMVSALDRKVEAFASQKANEDKRQFDNTKPLEHSAELKNMESSTQDSKDEMNQLTAITDNSTSSLPISEERFRFNAADYLLGAFVEIFLSSSSSLHTEKRFDQSELVLLDRPQPPANKAWCTNDKNPVLTIKLAKYIKPISVSYQHSKWKETIPKEAPKTYDVVACLGSKCKEWEPLASNCLYSQHEPNGAEQMCNITSDLDVRRIGKVQFRFRENYGHTRKTCVSLVRVYGETETPVKMEKHLNSEQTCAVLKYYYYTSDIGYATVDKSCRVLYENECCSECPECCQECLIVDKQKADFNEIFSAAINLSGLLFFLCLVICILRAKTKNQNLP
ncbi:unnamed protein product [Caenorhabditis nigoni]